MSAAPTRPLCAASPQSSIERYWHPHNLGRKLRHGARTITASQHYYAAPHPKVIIVNQKVPSPYSDTVNCFGGYVRNLPILAHFAVREGEVPTFSVRKSWYFGHLYFVAAKWEDGFCVKAASFSDKSAAEYWIEVEASHWADSLQHFAKAAVIARKSPAQIRAAPG